ncbi:Uncharacterized protein C8035_v006895 [Colletotrichum spinosum]|uniref:Methyltransferase-like protein 4 n=1 Tax=Colletotrichum spinosum TaxID=1347390 RepID=A0A4R8QSR1_9PEZI|nr:Uncharacterized protein C8035_v006895 [Colletotrichum spinosum]
MLSKQPNLSSQCILFQDESRSVTLIDIPTSIEESQFLPGASAETGGGSGGGGRRLLSIDPIAEPFPLPEPRNPHVNPTTPASQVADLMIEATVNGALDTLHDNYTAPFCLPRVTGASNISNDSNNNHDDCLQRDDSPDEAQTATPETHFIPTGTRYLSGLIEDTRTTFTSAAPHFDLVVLDPPWPNKSVKRKANSYATTYGLKETRSLLEQIPVGGHLADGGLVAIWVTNKPALVDLLTSPRGVLAGWGLEVATEWIWLKITSRGEPIFDTASAWRKPWERLIIAKKRGDDRNIPQRVVAAVPDIHSRKPNLRCLFEDLLPRDYRGLEIFARNLTAGWWGWGDEVLRFQSPEHWTTTTQQHTPSAETSNTQ